MALSLFVIVFLVSLTFSASSQSKGSGNFGVKVKNDISEDTYKKVFAANFEDPNDFVKAADEATDRLEKVDDITITDHVYKQLHDEAVRLAHKITSSLLFNIYTRAIRQTLSDEGVLTKDVIGWLAKKYADELKESAKSLSKDDNIKTTMPALSAANARFFKTLGLATNEFGRRFARNIIIQTKKH